MIATKTAENQRNTHSDYSLQQTPYQSSKATKFFYQVNPLYIGPSHNSKNKIIFIYIKCLYCSFPFTANVVHVKIFAKNFINSYRA